MRLKTSHLFAISVLVLVGLFFLIGTVLHGAKAGSEAKKPPTSAEKLATPTVQVTSAPETLHPYLVELRGRTEAARTVVARSETAGVVSATPAVEGTFVAKGAVLCRLNVDARAASLAQAKAGYRSSQLTQQASTELAKQGFRSQTQVLKDQAAMDSAQALVRQAEIAMEQTNIRAPFDGVFDKRDAEIGTYLAPGQSCGTVIELDPILIVADLPESAAGKFLVGAPATAKLLSGETLSGHVRYIARDADPQSRTYHVEVTARAPGSKARSGLSARVLISAGAGPAHLVPVSALVLDARGRQGVRYVTANDMVAFSPVEVIEEAPGGIWVSGLTGQVRVITVGQSYVAEGQKVKVGAAG